MNWKYLYKNKHWELNKEYNLDKLLYLMIDRPNKNYDDYFVWQNNKKQIHRDYDLPSCIFYGQKYAHLWWYDNGLKHRVKNKPTYIDFNGITEHWQKGKHIIFNSKQKISFILLNLIDRPNEINHYNDTFWFEINFQII